MRSLPFFLSLSLLPLATKAFLLHPTKHPSLDLSSFGFSSKARARSRRDVGAQMVVIDGQGFSNNLTVDVGCEGVCTNYIAADIECQDGTFPDVSICECTTNYSQILSQCASCTTLNPGDGTTNLTSYITLFNSFCSPLFNTSSLTNSSIIAFINPNWNSSIPVPVFSGPDDDDESGNGVFGGSGSGEVGEIVNNSTSLAMTSLGTVAIVGFTTTTTAAATTTPVTTEPVKNVDQSGNGNRGRGAWVMALALGVGVAVMV